MATDAHEDRCEAMPTPQCPSGEAGVHRGVEGRPGVARSQSRTDPTPGRACSGDSAMFRKTLDAAERGHRERQNFEEAPRS
jgi:hypothetical protein